MNTQENCCQEYERAAGLSRRRFLQGMAAAGATAVTTTMFGDALRQASFGATGGNVLVVISLRGGIDGLGMVVPHGDPAYYAARRNIAVPATSLVAKDAFFGLHPAMKPLEWMYQGGELAAVHAVGMPQPNRSHFLAMEEIEDAAPGSEIRQGWVNRMIGLDTDGAPSEAVHLTDSIVPTMLVGDAPSLSTNKLSRIQLSGDKDKFSAARRQQLQTMWGSEQGALGDAVRSAVATAVQLSPIAQQRYVSPTGVTYPRTWPAADLSDALKDSAQLIRANVGTEVISIDYGSWDMHSNYGTASGGEMTAMVSGFAATLDAFLRDLADIRSQVTVVTISEFGRRVAENGNRGLDHGWGNMMLVMGGGVKGGRYYGQWPWLGKDKLVDGDLKVTTDYRNVLGEIVTSRFPDRSVSKVFPGVTYSPLGLMR
ncbi:MAG: DUF1501 domain-containing protein [Actinomycetota bacterium]|nr:DUF1501 domain-containing protein [Actinomycetota bacterium]